MDFLLPIVICAGILLFVFVGARKKHNEKASCAAASMVSASTRRLRQVESPAYIPADTLVYVAAGAERWFACTTVARQRMGQWLQVDAQDRVVFAPFDGNDSSRSEFLWQAILRPYRAGAKQWRGDTLLGTTAGYWASWAANQGAFEDQVRTLTWYSLRSRKMLQEKKDRMLQFQGTSFPGWAPPSDDADQFWLVLPSLTDPKQCVFWIPRLTAGTQRTFRWLASISDTKRNEAIMWIAPGSSDDVALGTDTDENLRWVVRLF